jgi:hypothetical protein
LFIGASSETLRKVPDRVQIDTTLNRQNCIQNHAVKGRRPLLNRTAVDLTIVTTFALLGLALSLLAGKGGFIDAGYMADLLLLL